MTDDPQKTTGQGTAKRFGQYVSRILMRMLKQGYVLVLVAAIASALLIHQTDRTFVQMHTATGDFSAEIYEESRRERVVITPESNPPDTLREKETYREIIKNRVVTEKIAQQLEQDIDYKAIGKCISSEFIPGTNILRVTVTSSDKQLTADIINALFEVAPQVVDERMYGFGALIKMFDPDEPEPSNAKKTVQIDIMWGVLIGFSVSLLVAVITDRVIQNKIKKQVGGKAK